MSESEISVRNKGFPKRRDTQRLFWENMVKQRERNPQLSIQESIRIARERTADQKLAIRAKERTGKDWLTGLLNKRGLNEAIKKKIAEAKRQGAKRNITHVTIDVDNLKSKNDSEGHKEGDNLLRRVANAIKSTGREDDLYGRTGGDEFAAVFIDTNEEKALVYCKRLKNILDETGDHVSMGIALIDYSSPEMVESSIQGSDLAMLLAKATYKEGGVG
ncbi:MAG: GGDEF domain-containing protein [Candidatus Levybacteria bacterium]|nr:GGDEF domain-containing protein [Candidatus Levybacteria bacterium]